jgi:hypothetical protein
MAAPLRFLHLQVEHPGGHEKRADPTLQSKAVLRLTTEGGGQMREADLTEDQLVQLLAEGSRVLAILRGVRTNH